MEAADESVVAVGTYNAHEPPHKTSEWRNLDVLFFFRIGFS